LKDFIVGSEDEEEEEEEEEGDGRGAAAGRQPGGSGRRAKRRRPSVSDSEDHEGPDGEEDEEQQQQQQQGRAHGRKRARRGAADNDQPQQDGPEGDDDEQQQGAGNQDLTSWERDMTQPAHALDAHDIKTSINTMRPVELLPLYLKYLLLAELNPALKQVGAGALGSMHAVVFTPCSCDILFMPYSCPDLVWYPGVQPLCDDMQRH
jgi:hypothetical protein